MGFKLNVTEDLISFLSKRNYNLDDLIIVFCIENEDNELLNSYVVNRNIDQTIALFQRFERKLLIERVNDKGFTTESFITTEVGAALLLECMIYINNIEVIISESVGSIKEELVEDDLDKFVKEFLELYPIGRNKSGETLKSNLIDTKNKMKAFLKKYRTYNKETILKATKNYLLQQSRTGYEYCNAAHYFISKVGFGSKLASECDNILNGNAESIGLFTDQLM